MKKIFIFAIMFLAFLGLSINIQAFTPDHEYGYRAIRDNEIDFLYNGSTYSNMSAGWLQMNDGFMVLDYDGAGSLGNGLLPIGSYEIHSYVPEYNHMKIGPLEFQIYDYTYVFELDKGTSQGVDYLEIIWIYTDDPSFPDDVYLQGLYLDDMYVQLLNTSYPALTGYRTGYLKGELDGYEAGFAEGKDLGETIGFNEGSAYSANNNISILTIFQMIIGVVFSLLGFIINIEILNGITIAGLLGTGFAVVLLIWTLKAIRG